MSGETLANDTALQEKTAEGRGAAIEALQSLPLDLLEEDEAEQVAAVQHRVAESNLYVVALGEFKRGKSSLLNALLGSDVLPVGVVPLTSIVTMIRRGPSAAIAEYEDGHREEIDPADLRAFVTEAGNPDNRKGLRSVTVSVPSIHLPENTILVDTPGLGSVYESGTELTLAFLPHVDVALVVLSVDQTLTEAEERLARQLRDGGAQLVFVLNKADYFSAAELNEATHFIRDRLAAHGLDDCPLFVVSAKRARQEGHEAGVTALRRGLEDLLRQRSEALLDRLSRRRVRALLDDLETRYAVRDEIARSGAERLQNVLEGLATSRAEIQRLAEEQDALFTHRVRQIEREIAERSAVFEAELHEALIAELATLDEQLRQQPDERLIDTVLYKVIATRLQERAAREAHQVTDQLAVAARQLSAKLDEVAESLAATTEELLGVPVARPQQTQIDELRVPVDVKLRDDPVALETITGGLQATLPGALRRRLLLRRARERAAELSNRHAGRLRSELVAALRDAARQAQRQSHAELDRLQRSLDKAIEHGMAHRTMAEHEAEAERERVAQVRDALARARTYVTLGNSQ